MLDNKKQIILKEGPGALAGEVIYIFLALQIAGCWRDGLDPSLDGRDPVISDGSSSGCGK